MNFLKKTILFFIPKKYKNKRKFIQKVPIIFIITNKKNKEIRHFNIFNLSKYSLDYKIFVNDVEFSNNDFKEYIKKNQKLVLLTYIKSKSEDNVINKIRHIDYSKQICNSIKKIDFFYEDGQSCKNITASALNYKLNALTSLMLDHIKPNSFIVIKFYIHNLNYDRVNFFQKLVFYLKN